LSPDTNVIKYTN